MDLFIGHAAFLVIRAPHLEDSGLDSNEIVPLEQLQVLGRQLLDGNRRERDVGRLGCLLLPLLAGGKYETCQCRI